MLGAVVNTMAVLVGGGIGLLCKKGIPDRVADAVMKILGAFVLCLGITGIFEGENPLVLLVSIVLGTIIGEVLNIDAGITRLGTLLEKKSDAAAGSFTQGFVAATLLFCVGAMGIVGAIQAGTTGDTTTHFAKSVLDAVEAMMLAAALGVGVLASAACRGRRCAAVRLVGSRTDGNDDCRNDLCWVIDDHRAGTEHYGSNEL